jgi:hypothetical protein
MTIEVVATATWMVHWPGLNNAGGGISGQVTKCRLAGVVFYVRENLAGKGGMTMCSAERLGMKAGRTPSLPQVLDVLAPAGRWEEFAEAVRAADTLGRPARRHRQFTWAWAERLFARKE